MSSTITALTSGGGLAMAGDTSGQLELKTNNGTTAVTIDTAQNATVVGNVTGSALIPSGSTVPTNGVFLPSTNIVGFSTATTERMRILGNGAILLGCTTENGAAGISFSNTSDSATYGKTIYNNSPYNGTRNAQYWAYNGSVVGYIQTSTSSTSYVTSSDYRLKENIAPMTGALATVAQLKPCTYKWKLDGKNGQGFIAHELQAIVPDCVAGEKDAIDKDGKPAYQGVDTSFLVATLTAAIQEQQAMITALQADVQALKGVA